MNFQTSWDWYSRGQRVSICMHGVVRTCATEFILLIDTFFFFSVFFLLFIGIFYMLKFKIKKSMFGVQRHMILLLLLLYFFIFYCTAILDILADHALNWGSELRSWVDQCECRKENFKQWCASDVTGWWIQVVGLIVLMGSFSILGDC